MNGNYYFGTRINFPLHSAKDGDLNGLPMAACYWQATVVIMWFSHHYTVG
jgi:hypothetical protein